MDATIYEVAKRWGRFPWEVKQATLTDVNELIEMENLEAFYSPKVKTGDLNGE